MNIKEFTEKIKNELSIRLGGEYRIIEKEVMKNNRVLMHGVLICKRDQNIAPTIYMEAFLEQYQRGMSWDQVIEQIIAVYEKGVPKASIDMEFFAEFDKVKDRIVYKLVNAKQNEEMLSEIPHIEFLDLAICFCYLFSNESLGEGSILIRNNHIEMWQTNTKELFGMAQKNTVRLLGVNLNPMEKLLAKYYEECEAQDWLDEDLCSEIGKNVPMMVLSNRKGMFGATVILYPGILQEIADGVGGNLYILPSSVHEVLILEDTGKENPVSLREMVEEVNATQVLPEEVLSGSVYYYDRALKRVRIVA